MNIGIIGCGAISGIYLENLTKSARVRVTAVADLDLSRAKAAAAKYGARAVSVDELIGARDVDLVLNLTTPDAHESLARRAVEAGKHVYNEKPLCIDPKAARDLLELARRKNVRVGCAPDTVLGAGIQTSRTLVADGAIGDPVGGLAFMLCPGHESWHPDPAFYYKKGGGPVLDMGPYYITALVTILGPVTGVRSTARKTRPQRTITSQPKHGQTIDVEVATHCVGILEFASGASVSATLSFDVHRSRCTNIEIWGTKGSLAVPDPNGFGGPVSIFKPGDKDWSEAPLVDAPSHNARGFGVEDMAIAIVENRPHRASGALALHVLDVMTAMATGATAKIEPPTE